MSIGIFLQTVGDWTELIKQDLMDLHRTDNLETLAGLTKGAFKRMTRIKALESSFNIHD